MTTPLTHSLRRALSIKGKPYVVTIDEDGLKLVEKGRRLGLLLKWNELVSGEAALATALSASLFAPRRAPAAEKKAARSKAAPPAPTKSAARGRVARPSRRRRA